MACDNQDAVAEQNDEWIVAHHHFSEASMDRVDNARTRPWLPSSNGPTSTLLGGTQSPAQPASRPA